MTHLPATVMTWCYVAMHVVWSFSPRAAIWIVLLSFAAAGLVCFVVGRWRYVYLAAAFAWLGHGLYPLLLVGVPREVIAVVASVIIGAFTVAYGRADLASVEQPFRDPISRWLGDDEWDG